MASPAWVVADLAQRYRPKIVCHSSVTAEMGAVLTGGGVPASAPHVRASARC